MLPYRFVLPAALAAAAPLSMLAAQTAIAPPRAVPLTESVHGVTLADEYRWMEDPAAKGEWGGWVKSEGQRTRAMLDAVPVRADFARLITETSSSLTRAGGYQRSGTTEIFSRTLPGEQVAKLMVRDAKGTRVLIDPPKALGNNLAAMGAYALSPDGKTVAVHLSAGGSEVGSVKFFDTASGKEAYPEVPHMWGERSAVFLPGGMIAYTQLADQPVEGDPLKGMTTWLRPLAGGTPIKLFGAGMPGTDLGIAELPSVAYSRLSPFVLGIGGGARADFNLYVAPFSGFAVGKPHWVKIAALDDRMNGAAMLGSRLFYVTSKANSARDVMVRTLDAGGRAGPARLVLKGTDKLIINDVAATSDGLYVLAASDGVQRVLFSPGGSGKMREVAMPFEGTNFAYSTDGTEDSLILGLTGWTRNGTTYRLRGGKVIPTGIESGAWSGSKDLSVERYEAVSADGTRVPLVVTRLKSAKGRVPTLVEAYGGYGIDTSTPFYNRTGMAFIAKGGAMAYCGVRGGGERGRAWHEGGRGPNKPRGQEDLIACAETLTAKGIAPSQGPVSIGSSMAGVLVPGAALRKPSAFGGMVTRVGVVNASRIGAAENGANQFGEMGDPAVPQQFKDLVAMDAYQMIPTAASLPPTMMVIGMNDHRVAPWMTAKFVPRARAKWPNASIWLRSDDKAGHGMGSTEDVRRDEASDIFAFAWINQQPR